MESRWYRHHLDRLVATDDITLMWDTTNPTARKISANRTNICFRNKKTNTKHQVALIKRLEEVKVLRVFVKVKASDLLEPGVIINWYSYALCTCKSFDKVNSRTHMQNVHCTLHRHCQQDKDKLSKLKLVKQHVQNMTVP